MNFRFAVDVIGAILAGALIPFQTVYNTQLARAVQSPLVPLLAVFVAGFLVTAAFMLVMRTPLPSAAQVIGAPLLSWVAGGFFAAVYLVLLIILAPRLGAGAAVALVMVGQIVFSGMIDHFGLLGFEQHPLNWPRLAGMGLLAAGAALVRMF